MVAFFTAVNHLQEDLLGNRSLLQRVQRVGRFRSILFVSFYRGPLVNHSENHNNFVTLEFAWTNYWKAHGLAH